MPEELTVAQLNEKLGEIAYQLSQAESVVRQAQEARGQLQGQAGELISQIAQAESQ